MPNSCVLAADGAHIAQYSTNTWVVQFIEKFRIFKVAAAGECGDTAVDVNVTRLRCRVLILAVCQVMAKGIFAFFASHTPSTLNTIKSYSSTFRMPFVTTGMAVNTSRQEIGYELYVRPLYAKALVDIMSHYDWKEVWYIYDSNEG
jgi:hypothetical protein